MLDFNQFPVNNYRLFGGANGKKICIDIDGDLYMLKVPVNSKYKKGISYTNSTMSEYLACKIAKILGYSVQDVLLGYYTINGSKKLSVACKDLESEGYNLKDFAYLKNAVVTSESEGYSTDLLEILDTIHKQVLVDPILLETFFWDQFIVDTLLGNFDRHNGNWGFLIGKSDASVSPIYDCGSCLYPQATDERMNLVFTDESELLSRMYVFPNSAIKQEGVKLNYHNFLVKDNINLQRYPLLRKAVSRMLEVFTYDNIRLIEELIQGVPELSELHKEFYMKMLLCRFELLVKAIPLDKTQNEINLF